MIQTATRPFTDAEREEVERQLLNWVSEPRPDIYHGLWGAFLGFVCGAVFSLVAMLLVEASHIWGMVILAGFVFFGIVLGWQGKLGPEDKFLENRRQYAAILARRLQRGEMEEVTVSASSVVQIEDRYDGITGYFFDIGDRKILYLGEDTLWNAAEQAGPDERDADTFLPSAFRLIRYPDACDEVLRLEPLGPLLTPIRTVFATEAEEYYELIDGDVIEDVSLATLESDLPYLFTTEPDE